MNNPPQQTQNEQGVREVTQAAPQQAIQQPQQDISATAQQAAQQLETSNLQAQKLTLQEILDAAISQKASDIHLSVGYRVMVRVDGTLKNLQSNVMQNDDVIEIVKLLLQDRKDITLEDIEQVDLSYEYKDTRFRVNIFKEMNNFSVVMRLIPSRIMTLDELDLPQVLKNLVNVANGLILVTGPTGSGKSTTIASMLNLINLTQPRHIITLEDPVEYVFPKGMGLIDQREYGIDFSQWTHALRSALRQDPDVVLVGEMRDFETIASTITLSETGHLVFATLHTNSASQSIDRIIDVFPAGQQAQIRAQLANVLSAVISQRLVPIQGGGRKAALEIMITTSGIRNAIREGKTNQIDNMIQTGQDLGMITMEQSLVNMVANGIISIDQAKAVSSKPAEIDLLLNRNTQQLQ